MDTQSDTRKIEIDAKSGFCFGVINAIKKAEEALEVQKKLYCLGDIVHNGAEVERLEGKGLITISQEEFRELKDCTVLLRAHGEPPETYEIAKQNNITIIDATCPVVLHLQKKIKQGYESQKEQGGQVLLFGKQGHAETIGLQGQTGNNAIIIESIEDLDKVNLSKPTELFSQTTKSLHEFVELQEKIREKKQAISSEEISFVSHDTVCRQVSNRELDLKKFAWRFEAILFASGKKSSNGKVLYSICKQENPNTFFVSNVDDVKQLDLSQFRSIGICGATSTPKWLMEDIANYIRELSK